MKFEIKVETEERESLKKFKEYICNRYRVKNVNDTPISIEEYAELMTIYEAGWDAREQLLVDKLFGANKNEINISFSLDEINLLNPVLQQYIFSPYNFSSKEEYEKYNKLYLKLKEYEGK